MWHNIIDKYNRTHIIIFNKKMVNIFVIYNNNIFKNIRSKFDRIIKYFGAVNEKLLPCTTACTTETNLLSSITSILWA